MLTMGLDPVLQSLLSMGLPGINSEISEAINEDEEEINRQLMNFMPRSRRFKNVEHVTVVRSSMVEVNGQAVSDIRGQSQANSVKNANPRILIDGLSLSRKLLDIDMYVSLDSNQQNELLFKVTVEGTRPAANKVRLVCEGVDGISIMFHGRSIDRMGLVRFNIPPLRGVLPEGTYAGRLEVLVDDRYFAPVKFGIRLGLPGIEEAAGTGGGVMGLKATTSLKHLNGGDEYKDDEDLLTDDGLAEVLIRELVHEVIHKCGSKYCLYTKHKKGGKRRKLGTHTSKASAERQEKAIHTHGG